MKMLRRTGSEKNKSTNFGRTPLSQDDELLTNLNDSMIKADLNNDGPSSISSAAQNNDPSNIRSMLIRKKSTKKGSKKNKKQLFDDEMDPYDSDPGGSYRSHCLQIRGTSDKSCLQILPFRKKPSLKVSSSSSSSNTKSTSGPEQQSAEDSESTAAPSPLNSELGDDVLIQTPASIPSDKVRYSLRTTIGDGSEEQPSMDMEQRELRPNNIKLNVSHWSDQGGRNYMEDR